MNIERLKEKKTPLMTLRWEGQVISYKHFIRFIYVVDGMFIIFKPYNIIYPNKA